MIRILSIIIIGLLFSAQLTAQEYQKKWNDGKLTWQDFTERETSQGISELKYFFGYNDIQEKYGDTTVLRIKAKCYIDKNLSWINPAYKNEKYLRYNQIIFDILELHRRKLQFELDRVNAVSEIEKKFSYILSLCNDEISKFSQETNEGNEIGMLNLWENKISNELELIPDYNIPGYENMSFGYAAHVGFGAGLFAGALGEHFSPSFDFIFGFDFSYKKSILYFNGTLAGSKVKKDYISDKSWYEGQKANLSIIDISYGYTFIDGRKIKLSPFAGIGITELTGMNKDDRQNGLRIVDYNLIGGINADYKLKTLLNFTPYSYLKAKEKIETSIRARLYVTRANYYSNLQGYSINLTIGFCGFGNTIRLK